LINIFTEEEIREQPFSKENVLKESFQKTFQTRESFKERLFLIHPTDRINPFRGITKETPRIKI
jgi:hypothetical protein